MPIMTVKEFEKRTSVGALRGSKFSAISDRLRDYNRTASVANLQALADALRRWQFGHTVIGGGSDSWKLDRRNQVAGKGHPVEELSNWVTRKLLETQLQGLRSAASDILRAYGDMMDHQYRGKLIEMFLGNVGDSVEPLYCINYWENDGTWMKRLNVFGAPPKTGAFCVPLTTANRNGPGGGAVRIKSDTAPENRQIEFGSNWDHHSLAHELLHWCTHEAFETHTHGMSDKILGKFIREGLTEWLTRNGLNEWNKGGYIDFFPIWKDLFDAGTVVIKDVILPYFHGIGVAEFCNKVKPSITANKDYKAGQLAMLKAAFAGKGP